MSSNTYRRRGTQEQTFLHVRRRPWKCNIPLENCQGQAPAEWLFSFPLAPNLGTSCSKPKTLVCFFDIRISGAERQIKSTHKKTPCDSKHRHRVKKNYESKLRFESSKAESGGASAPMGRAGAGSIFLKHHPHTRLGAEDVERAI